MQTIYRQDAGRITVADAKQLIRKASPVERVVDVYVEVGPDNIADPDAPLIIKQGTARLYDLSIESDFDELCKQLSIEPRNRWRPALTGFKSGTGQDALYTIDHAEFVRLTERHGGTVVVRPSTHATPVVTTSEHADLEKIVDWYNATLGADVWRKLPALKPEDAALLLSEFSPSSTSAAGIKADGVANLQVDAEEFALMLRTFEALSTEPRSLADWRQVAKEFGLTYHDWIDQYETAMALLDPSNVPKRPTPIAESAATAEPSTAAAERLEVNAMPAKKMVAAGASTPVPPRRQSWWEATSPYMARMLKAGRYAKAKELFFALHEEAGTAGSPFEKGTGTHRGDLFVPDSHQSVSLKTIQNRWSELKAAAFNQ